MRGKTGEMYNIYFLEAKNSLDQTIIYGYTYYNSLKLLVLVIYQQGAFARSPQKTHSDSIGNRLFFKYRKPFNQRIISVFSHVVITVIIELIEDNNPTCIPSIQCSHSVIKQFSGIEK